jgi:hypothetical protein
VGSDGNREATRFLEKELAAAVWKTSAAEFDAIDWYVCLLEDYVQICK